MPIAGKICLQEEHISDKIYRWFDWKMNIGRTVIYRIVNIRWEIIAKRDSTHSVSKMWNYSSSGWKVWLKCKRGPIDNAFDTKHLRNNLNICAKFQSYREISNQIERLFNLFIYTLCILVPPYLSWQMKLAINGKIDPNPFSFRYKTYQWSMKRTRNKLSIALWTQHQRPGDPTTDYVGNPTWL